LRRWRRVLWRPRDRRDEAWHLALWVKVTPASLADSHAPSRIAPRPVPAPAAQPNFAPTLLALRMALLDHGSLPGRGLDLGEFAQPQLDRVHASSYDSLEQRLERELPSRLAAPAINRESSGC